MDWRQARRAVLPQLKPTTRALSSRRPWHLLEGIKRTAHARDVPYPSLIKVWPQEKLHAR